MNSYMWLGAAEYCSQVIIVASYFQMHAPYNTHVYLDIEHHESSNSL